MQVWLDVVWHHFISNQLHLFGGNGADGYTAFNKLVLLNW
jgi:hypothetical protein